MAVHIVYLKPTNVLNGVVIDKNTATIAEVMRSDIEMRVVPDANIANSLNSPSIKEYIEKEANDGYKLVSINNTMIVTASS